MNIYFSGSIRGGRDLQPVYKQIIQALKVDGHRVLSEHVGAKHLNERISDEEIYRRDIHWINEADCMIADVTIPSLGVGFEIHKAVVGYYPILCLAQNGNETNVSAMISGCPFLRLARYESPQDAIDICRVFLRDLKPQLGQYVR